MNAEKPTCQLVGQNGNIFNLVGIASRALKSAGLRDEAKEMTDKVFQAGSYDEALSIIMEYVDDECMDDSDDYGCMDDDDEEDYS